jgi:hypothetical protein
MSGMEDPTARTVRLMREEWEAPLRGQLADLAMERDQASAYIETLRGALRDAISGVVGPISLAPMPIYTPQVSIERVERWRRALRDGAPIASAEKREDAAP